MAVVYLVFRISGVVISPLEGRSFTHELVTCNSSYVMTYKRIMYVRYTMSSERKEAQMFCHIF